MEIHKTSQAFVHAEERVLCNLIQIEVKVFQWGTFVLNFLRCVLVSDGLLYEALTG